MPGFDIGRVEISITRVFAAAVSAVAATVANCQESRRIVIAFDPQIARAVLE